MKKTMIKSHKVFLIYMDVASLVFQLLSLFNLLLFDERRCMIGVTLHVSNMYNSEYSERKDEAKKKELESLTTHKSDSNHNHECILFRRTKSWDLFDQFLQVAYAHKALLNLTSITFG